MVSNRSSRVLVAVVILGVLGCADRNTSLDGADQGPTTSASSESGGETSSSSDSTGLTSTTDSSDTSTDTDDETPGFVVRTDAHDESCMCDPWWQDCPEGEKCVPYASTGEFWDCVKCVPIVGEQAVGEPCSSEGPVSSTDDCNAEGYCFTPGSEGTCLAFCDGTIDDFECGPGMNCIVTSNGNITLCMPACSPLLQDCEVGSGCFWLETGFACMYTGGNAATGQPCTQLNDCALGNFCASDLPECGDGSCCVAHCDLDEPDCPTMGTECVAFFEPNKAPAGLENVGVCLSL